MTWLEFIETLKWAPDISGSQGLGWEAKYQKKNDKANGYFLARFKPGTLYQDVVRAVTAAINE